MGTASSEESVVAVYDRLSSVYEYSWNREGHQSIHLGYYETGSESLKEATRAMAGALADQVTITANSHVLDIGCGAGEDAVWLAETYGASVTGVDINPEFVRRARENADDAGLTETVEFREDSFHALSTVADGTVDIVWGLEALAHSNALGDVFDQSARVLDAGGQILLGDLFRTGQSVSETDRRRIDRIERTMALDLDDRTTVRDRLDQAGFDEIEFRETTAAVLPGTKRSARYGTVFSPVCKALNLVGVCDQSLVDFIQTSVDIHKLLERDALSYEFVTASRQ